MELASILLSDSGLSLSPQDMGPPGARWVPALDVLWDLQTPDFPKQAAPSLLPEPAWASSLSQWCKGVRRAPPNLRGLLSLRLWTKLGQASGVHRRPHGGREEEDLEKKRGGLRVGSQAPAHQKLHVPRQNAGVSENSKSQQSFPASGSSEELNRTLPAGWQAGSTWWMETTWASPGKGGDTYRKSWMRMEARAKESSPCPQ